MAKYIKRQLPADHYKLVDSYSLSPDDYIICENCGKVIRNIGIVEDSKGKRFCVGLDCAATLSGIDEYDIEYYNNGFNIAKAIRAKIRRETKKGASIEVRNYYYDKPGQLQIRAINADYIGGSCLLEEVSTDFIKKYLPELAKVAQVNENFAAIDAKTFSIEDGGTFRGYTFHYQLKAHEKWGHTYAYAEILKDGKVIKTGSNGGTDTGACMYECGHLYNDVAFAAGLHALA